MKNSIKVLIVLLLIFVSSCDSPPNEGIKKTHDVTGEYIDIRVMTFKSQSSLQRHIDKNNLSNDDVEGLAQWVHPKNDLSKVKRCEIYVVEPSGVKDYSTMQTWGHELAHCMYGSYHKEGER